MKMKIDKIDIEKCALKVRHENNVFTYGVKDIFSLISSMNIYLIRYPFGKDKILGFTTFFEGKKVIVSNSSEILSREIYTIAHELGHAIYDFSDNYYDIKIHINDDDKTKDFSEARAYYFADCFLMPDESLKNYIKFELKKNYKNLTSLDIVLLQNEFQVSYAAMVLRLYDLKFIDENHKCRLFNERDELTSRKLFSMVGADERLLNATNKIYVPKQFFEYVISNYENGYIPFSSFEKALSLIGEDAKIFKKDLKNEELQDEDELDINDVFEEFE